LVEREEREAKEMLEVHEEVMDRVAKAEKIVYKDEDGTLHNEFVDDC
jgi:hypothetical protein